MVRDKGAEMQMSDIAEGMVQPFYLTGNDPENKTLWCAAVLPD